MKHFKLDEGLINALIEQWKRETHIFHLRNLEKTPILQDIIVLFELLIDGHAITSNGMSNLFTLCEHAFRVTPFPIELKKGGICLKWFDEIFVTPSDNVDEEVLCRYALNYDFNILHFFELFFNLVMIIERWCKYASVYLLHMFGNILFMDLTHVFIWCSLTILMWSLYIARVLLSWHVEWIMCCIHEGDKTSWGIILHFTGYKWNNLKFSFTFTFQIFVINEKKPLISFFKIVMILGASQYGLTLNFEEVRYDYLDYISYTSTPIR